MFFQRIQFFFSVSLAVFACGSVFANSDPLCGGLLGGSAYVYQDVTAQRHYTVHPDLAAVRVVPGAEARFVQALSSFGAIEQAPIQSVFARSGRKLIKLNAGISYSQLQAAVLDWHATGLIDYYAPALREQGGSGWAVTTGEIRMEVAVTQVAAIQALLNTPRWDRVLEFRGKKSTDPGIVEFSLMSRHVIGTEAYDLRAAFAAAVQQELGSQVKVYLNFIQSVPKRRP